MKTKGMAHQIEALKRMDKREWYGLFMEQGTGKTWCILADAERRYAQGDIDGLLILAPKGVHTNWVRREIPAHCSFPHIARVWMAGMGKRAKAKLMQIFAPRDDGEQPPMRILAMNIDAINGREGFELAQRFLNSTNAMMVVDESSRIKTMGAERTKQALRLRSLAKIRRIATGTPITNAPADVFAQMEFLESGLLDTTSERAFIAEYACLMDTSDPIFRKMVQRNPRIAFAQIVAKDENGNKLWRNLDRLQRLLEPHTYRVLKKDCLDLPAKIYKDHFFKMGAKQATAYKLMEDDLRISLGGDDFETVKALNSITKLQQITSGFVLQKSGEPLYVSEDNPRLAALLDMVEDIDGKFIVWARFREELRAIAEALRKAGYKVGEYHGGIKTKDREAAVDGIQEGDLDCFVANPQSGGIGLTLTKATTVIYYSNDFNLETRLQSEDRTHRKGTISNILYIDLVAEGTIDEAIARALQRKEDVAAVILNDVRGSLLGQEKEAA